MVSQVSSDDRGPPLFAYPILVASAVFLACNVVLGRYAVASMDPWTLAFGRWALAAIILLPFAGRGLAAAWPALRRQARPILVLGFLGMIVCGGGVYVSLLDTTATNATLIYTSSPVLILLLEYLFRGETIRLGQTIGIVVAILGVVAIVTAGMPARLLELDFNRGDIGIAAAALSWAAYSVILRRPGLAAIPTLALFNAIALVGAAMLAPFMLMELSAGGRPPVGAGDWLIIAVLALVPSVGAFTAYQYSVKTVGTTLTGIFMYLTIPVGVLLSVFALGEEFRAFHAAGMALVLSGVVLATAPRLRRS